jgi:hypothetical protein
MREPRVVVMFWVTCGVTLLAAFHDEVRRVVGLVGVERDPPPVGHGLHELNGRQRLGVAGPPRRHSADHQPVRFSISACPM